MRRDQEKAVLLRENIEKDRAIGQLEKREVDNPPYLRLIQWLLCITAIVSFAWPVYRAFLNVEIENNEGWNAYFADAAMGKMPLYPAAAELITNNYPPLSFYIVGLLGKVVGDPVLAGRLLSLLSVVAIATAIASSVRRLGGTLVAGIIGGAFFVATMSRFLMSYVGMNEPQLLSHAIMCFGFVGFLAARSNDRGYVWPVLVMALAGFVKHNIIGMPLAVFVWLALHRPREAIKCFCVAAIAIAMGAAICAALFGQSFFLNILAPRHYSINRALHAWKDLQWVSVGLIACVCNAWIKWRDANVRLCSWLVVIALLVFFLQKTGAGVDVNSQFDLVIAVAIGVGVAYTQIASWPLARRFSPAFAQAILLLAVCVRLLASNQMQPLRLLADRSFRTEIAIRQQAMAESVERVRRIQGDVLCPLLISYRAGKPFVVDKFNAEQRILAGALPADALTARLAAGTLTVVDVDQRARWSEEQKHFDFAPIATLPFHSVQHREPLRLAK